MKMNKYILLILMLCSITVQAAAQDDAVDADSVGINKLQVENKNILVDDALLIHRVYISPDTLSSWKNKKQFSYQKNLDSLLLNEKNKSADNSNTKNAVRTISFLDRLFNASFIKILLWILAIFFLGIILKNLVSIKGIFKKSNSEKNMQEQATEEDLFLTRDYDALLHQSYKLQDYRMATRYLFLKTLQRLNHQSLIVFAADKTNSKYVHEISAGNRNEFAAIVMNYEYVWYGNIKISKELFDKIQVKFSTFLNKI